MALKKSIETQYGTNAEYWKISRITTAFGAVTEVVLNGYTSQTAREEDKSPIAAELFSFLPPTLSTDDEHTRPVVYNLIKALPTLRGEPNPFMTAEDC
jgi:hypothetical protein